MTDNNKKQLFILLMGSAFLVLLSKAALSKPQEPTPAFDFNFTIIE